MRMLASLGVVVASTCLVDGVVNDVMHGANRHVDAEEIAAKFVNAEIGTVAEERQGEGGLLELEMLGDRQLEEHLIVGAGRAKASSRAASSTVALLIDKLAADACVVGQNSVMEPGVRGQPLARRG